MARTKVTARMSYGERPPRKRVDSTLPASSADPDPSSSSAVAPSLPTPAPSSNMVAPSRHAQKLRELLAKQQFFHLPVPVPQALRDEFKDHPTLNVHFNDSSNYDKSMMNFSNRSDEKALVCVFETGNNRLKIVHFKNPEFAGWRTVALMEIPELRKTLADLDAKIVKARDRMEAERSSVVSVQGTVKEEDQMEAVVERDVVMERGKQGRSREVDRLANSRQLQPKSPEPIILDDAPEPTAASPISTAPCPVVLPESSLVRGSWTKKKDQTSLLDSAGDIVVEPEAATPMEVDEASSHQNGIVDAAVPIDQAVSSTSFTDSLLPPTSNAELKNVLEDQPIIPKIAQDEIVEETRKSTKRGERAVQVFFFSDEGSVSAIREKVSEREKKKKKKVKTWTIIDSEESDFEKKGKTPAIIFGSDSDESEAAVQLKPLASKVLIKDRKSRKNGKRPVQVFSDEDTVSATTEKVSEPEKKKKKKVKRPARELSIPPISPTASSITALRRSNPPDPSRVVVPLPARSESSCSLPPRPDSSRAPAVPSRPGPSGNIVGSPRDVPLPVDADSTSTKVEQDMMARLESLVTQQLDAMSTKLKADFDSQIAREVKNSREAQIVHAEAIVALKVAQKEEIDAMRLAQKMEIDERDEAPKAIKASVDLLSNSMDIAQQEHVEEGRAKEGALEKRIANLEAQEKVRRGEAQPLDERLAALEEKMGDRLALSAANLDKKIDTLDRQLSPSLLVIEKKQTVATKEMKKLDGNMKAHIIRSNGLNDRCGQFSASVEADQLRTDSEINALQTAMDQKVVELEQRLSSAEEDTRLVTENAVELESKLQEGLATITSTVDSLAGSDIDQKLDQIKQQISEMESNSTELVEKVREELSGRLEDRLSTVITDFDAKITALRTQFGRNPSLAALEQKLQAQHNQQKISINSVLEATRQEMQERFVALEQKISQGIGSSDLVEMQVEFQRVLDATTSTLIDGMEKRIIGVEEKLGRAVSSNLVECQKEVKNVADSTANISTVMEELEKLEKVVLAIDTKLNSADSVETKSKEPEESLSNVATTIEGMVELEKRLESIEGRFTLIDKIQLAVDRQAERVKDVSNHAVANGHALNRIETSLQHVSTFAQDEKIACDEMAQLVAGLKNQLETTDKLASWEYKRLRTRMDEKALKCEEMIAKLVVVEPSGVRNGVKNERDGQPSLSPPLDPTIVSAFPSLQSVPANANSTPPPSTIPNSLVVPDSSHAHSQSCPSQSVVAALQIKVVQLGLVSLAPCKLTAAVAEHTKHLQALSNRLGQAQQPLASQPVFSRLDTKVIAIDKELGQLSRDVGTNWNDSRERMVDSEDRVMNAVEKLKARLDAHDKARTAAS